MTDQTSDPQPTVYQALAAVMRDVGHVAKRDRNTQPGQQYNFRGIDTVINAVGPAFRAHGVIAVPVAQEYTDERYASKQGANMRNVTLRVTFRFYGPAGDYVEVTTFGEAADAGDKAMTKAHSVAFRTALIQTLCLPTDEPDPDATAHERATQAAAPPPPADPLTAAKRQVWALAQDREWSKADLEADYSTWGGGLLLQNATVEDLRQYVWHLNEAADAADAGTSDGGYS